ncbi:MAG: hypothetical protein WCW31_04700 [Patescibacteria group bacterium]
MGYGNWSDQSYDYISKSRASAPVDRIFTNVAAADPAMNSVGIKLRESRDSADHPESNAIAVFFDVTGSMGDVPELFARSKLGGLMKLIVSRNYIADPQILFGAIGDATCDRYPLQIGQFESSLEMDTWLTKIFLEGGGGGQIKESYGLAHHFAGNYTALDCFEKRTRKGYLFTMGDEKPWPNMPAAEINQVFGGSKISQAVSIEDAVKQASRMYHVFHIVIGGHTSHGDDPQVLAAWRKLLGERALHLAEPEGVCELIATTIGSMEGRDWDDMASDLAANGTSTAIVKAVGHAVQSAGTSIARVARASGKLPTAPSAKRGIRL